MEKGKHPGGRPGRSRGIQPGLISTTKHGHCDDYPSHPQAREPQPPPHLLPWPGMLLQMSLLLPRHSGLGFGPLPKLHPQAPTPIPCQGVLADWCFGEGGESREVRGVLGEEIPAVPGHKRINGLSLCYYPRGFQKPGNLGLGPSSVVSPLEGPGSQPFPCLDFTSSHGKERADYAGTTQCGPNPIPMASGLSSG